VLPENTLYYGHRLWRLYALDRLMAFLALALVALGANIRWAAWCQRTLGLEGAPNVSKVARLWPFSAWLCRRKNLVASWKYPAIVGGLALLYLFTHFCQYHQSLRHGSFGGDLWDLALAKGDLVPFFAGATEQAAFFAGAAAVVVLLLRSHLSARHSTDPHLLMQLLGFAIPSSVAICEFLFGGSHSPWHLASPVVCGAFVPIVWLCCRNIVSRRRQR